MLTCIACSKHVNDNNNAHGSLPPQDEEDNLAATPSTKHAIKSLTTQIKDMAVKASVAYKHCKPCSGSSDRGGYVDSDLVSEKYCGGSYTRRPANSPKLWGKDIGSTGSGTPASVSGRTESSIVFMEEDEPREWTAQVEPGVLITFLSLHPHGAGNDLKRIRFSREIFNKWQAQQWWAENYDKVVELYNVQRLNYHAVPVSAPLQSEVENSKIKSAEESPVTPPLSKERQPCRPNRPTGIGIGYSSSDSLEQQPVQSLHDCDSVAHNSTPKLSSISAAKTETSSIDASARSSSSREMEHSGELSMSNASDLESEWVEQDEPGVYITVRALPGGGRELRRVRFSRERFGEMHARTWWEDNRARIQQQYL